MRKRFKVPLLFIMILATSCSLIFASYFFLYHESYGMSVVADYPLSINFSTGEIIDKYNYEEVKFSVINSGDEDLLYTVNLVNTYSKDEITYLLESEDYSYEGIFETGEMTDSILIKGGETEYFTLKIIIEDSLNFEGEIKVVREISENLKFYQTVISDNDDILESSVSLIGKEESVTNEGLIISSDVDGSVYYFRGDVENNYVSFADNIWRIVKINSDGTVKLVLNSEFDVYEEYYKEDDYEFVESEVYESLTEWYDMYLSYYDDFIDNGSYCNDFSITNSENYTYGAYTRIVSSFGASFDCVDEEIYLKIGLLTADEVIYAGGTISEENKNFYLYSVNAYFTMTSAIIDDEDYYPFIVEDGQVVYDSVGTVSFAIKPVINIIKDSYVAGSGLIDDPYTIES